MPWWERRMWVEKLQEHLTPPDEDDDHDAFVKPSSTSDDVSAFGLSPDTLA